MKLVNRNFFLINFILLSFIAFVYFWDIKSSLIQIRFLIILLIFPYFFLSENRINSIVYFFFPVLFIFIHLITVSNILDIKINIQRIYEIFFLYYFLVIFYAYKEIILNYLNQFILIFLLIFLIISFFLGSANIDLLHRALCPHSISSWNHATIFPLDILLATKLYNSL